MRRVRGIIPKEKQLTKDMLRVIARVSHIKRDRPAPKQVPRHYEFMNTAKIISGYRAMDNIPKELQARNLSKPLIITQHDNLEKGILKSLIKTLANFGINARNILLCSKNGMQDTEEKAISEFRTFSCDSVIAVGGAVAFKLARAVCASYTNDQTGFCSIPFIAVPVANAGLEIAGDPDIIVLDPRLAKDQPPKITALCLIDAICHAVETYISPLRNPLSDAYAFSSIGLIRDNIHKALKSGKNKKVSLSILNALLLSSLAYRNSRQSLSHILSCVLEDCYKISHQEVIAIIFPHLLNQSLFRFEEYYGELLLPLAGHEIYAETYPYERGRKFVQIIRNMVSDYQQIYGIPSCLSEIGVKRQDFGTIVEKTLNLAENQSEEMEEEIRNILNFAF
ncbi:MAG: iron-containing alcohol dehydrogenase [Clostridiaceae bacterium]|nr:iron-containing alcohol dehydrogenase [Clostridiaceae bacterium]